MYHRLKIFFSIIKIALLEATIFLKSEIETSLEILILSDVILSKIYINSLTSDNKTFRAIPTLSLVGLQYFCFFNRNTDNDAKVVTKILQELLIIEYSFDDEVIDRKPFERFYANWELLYCALHNERKEIGFYKIYGLQNIN
ncbi:hypothetical protein F8M41_008359 [Gigaspora margarita]|uniref:LAGLIDADG endonuclease n=1 Tax=Gigaspora margarita TaxID=4874 RepID=A0A8H4A3P4_GIGMA|nr:hypothetical protein F8M41_008359 [Gigaspora margarita]